VERFAQAVGGEETPVRIDGVVKNSAAQRSTVNDWAIPGQPLLSQAVDVIPAVVSSDTVRNLGPRPWAA